MLCARGLGDTARAAREEKLFRRFKAEESSQAITQIRRAFSPEDNNERQNIHDHESSGSAKETTNHEATNRTPTGRPLGREGLPR